MSEDFTHINADSGVTEIESLCMSCEENGITRILATRIPFFKEVIVMSFSCPHCGFRSTDVHPGSEIAPKGSRFKLAVRTPGDANRTIVKSSFATVYIPELDLEIPANTQKGSLTTAEGIIQRISEDLERDLPLRLAVAPEQATQIQEFIPVIKNYLETLNYTLILDDPSGLSFIQPLNYPAPDPNLEVSHYERSREQTVEIGLPVEELTATSTTTDDVTTANVPKGQFNTILRDAYIAEKFKNRIEEPKEVFLLPVSCHLCQTEGHLKCFECNIPHFKTIVLMCFTCENCGYRSIEVKATGEVEDKGRRHVLKVNSDVDLKRDFLKSEYASVDIPEVSLHVSAGTLGGFFTTVEGIVTKCRDHLADSHPFYFGDSAVEEDRIKFKDFLRRMDELATGQRPFTLILDDPVGNSYIQSTSDDPAEDPALTVEQYERTAEQNEELGLI
ncbi:hypothetical protein RCL1_006849 [Eukaryota sp. TZLM3-RCL]